MPFSSPYKGLARHALADVIDANQRRHDGYQSGPEWVRRDQFIVVGGARRGSWESRIVSQPRAYAAQTRDVGA